MGKGGAPSPRSIGASGRNRPAVAARGRIRYTALPQVCDAGCKRPLRASKICMYTNTPDNHFLIDHVPPHERVFVISSCSGHGFKFASAIGEAVAPMVVDGQTRLDLSPFRLNRFVRRATD